MSANYIGPGHQSLNRMPLNRMVMDILLYVTQWPLNTCHPVTSWTPPSQPPGRVEDKGSSWWRTIRLKRRQAEINRWLLWSLASDALAGNDCWAWYQAMAGNLSKVGHKLEHTRTQGDDKGSGGTTRKEAFAEITDFVSQFGDNIVSIKTVSSSFLSRLLFPLLGFQRELAAPRLWSWPRTRGYRIIFLITILWNQQWSKEQYHVEAGSIEIKCQEIIPHFQPSSRMY